MLFQVQQAVMVLAVYDAFLMKADLSGNMEWFHTYGGYTSDNGYDVVESY